MKCTEGPYSKTKDDMTDDGLKSVSNDKIHPIKNRACIGTKCLTYGRLDKQ